jgi:small-conductance mechanosensitive channel
LRVLDRFLAQDPWTIAIAIAAAAVIGGLIVHRIGGALLRRATQRTPLLHAIVVAIEGPASAVLPLFALQAVWQAAPDDMARIGAVRHVNGVLLIAAMTWLAMCAVQGLADGVIARNPSDIADNLHARRVETQARILSRSAMVLILIGGAAVALMTFPGARHVGASILASAGVIGLVGGLAARPVFSNLIAGLQLAIAQPIRMGDVLVVKDQTGTVEEITGAYVVLRMWDDRRMIVPLNWFIENPFENWTRRSSELEHSVHLFVDFSTPLQPVRAEFERIVAAAPEWDKRVAVLQVVDATEATMKLRFAVSAGNSRHAFELGAKVREGMIAYLTQHLPGSLPRTRMDPPARA